jgi:hypothetical protein
MRRGHGWFHLEEMKRAARANSSSQHNPSMTFFFVLDTAARGGCKQQYITTAKVRLNLNCLQ